MFFVNFGSENKGIEKIKSLLKIIFLFGKFRNYIFHYLSLTPAVKTEE